MSAMSPGGRVCMKQPSIVTYKHISDEDVLTSLCTLRQIVQSCYGPRSKLKIIHNQSLGHLTITSTSGRLLNCLSISKPYLKFVVTSVAGHLEKYKDGGLYTLLLTLSLIENGIKTGLKLPLVSELFAYFGHETLSLIEEVKIAGMENDLSLKAMLRLVNGIVRPKHACYVKQTNLDFLCKLLLESFLNSVPSQEDQNSSFNEVLKLGVEGLDVTESRLWTGVLLPFVHSVISDSCHFTKPLKVVVLVTSLSGDSNEFIHAKYELRNLQTTAVNDVVIQLWMEVCQQLVNDGVSVVFCQKVVHPILQQFLHENSVHVIDRLGSAAMKSVTHLTDCAPVISLKEQSLSECYGKLDGIDVVTVNKKKFYHLKNDRNSATKTLILCNWSEQALEELKYVSNVVQHVLQMSIFHPDILPGGGCFETLITTKLHSKIFSNRKSLAAKFGCSDSQLLTSLRYFKRGFMDTIPGHGDKTILEHWRDNHYHHCWLDDEAKCQCGAVARTDTENLKNLCEIDKFGYVDSLFDKKVLGSDVEICDLAVAKVSSLRLIFNTASTMLKIGCMIQDLN